jgi:hypothetical protein
VADDVTMVRQDQMGVTAVLPEHRRGVHDAIVGGGVDERRLRWPLVPEPLLQDRAQTAEPTVRRHDVDETEEHVGLAGCVAANPVAHAQRRGQTRRRVAGRSARRAGDRRERARLDVGRPFAVRVRLAVRHQIPQHLEVAQHVPEPER